MEDIDLRKAVDVEKMSSHEFVMHQDKVRHMVAALSLEAQKPIDRITISGHAASYTNISSHMRMLSTFCREMEPFTDRDILQGLLKSSRQTYDSVRKDWLRAFTKVKYGVYTAENFSSFSIPGMSEKEQTAVRKLVKDPKNKRQDQGGPPSKRGRGRGGRGGYGNFRGGFGGFRGGYGGGGGYDSGFDPYDNRGIKEVVDQPDGTDGLNSSMQAMSLENLSPEQKVDQLRRENLALAQKANVLRASALEALRQSREFDRYVAGRMTLYTYWYVAVGNNRGRGYNNRGGAARGGGGYQGDNYRANNQGGGGAGGYGGGNHSGGGASNMG